MQHLSREQQLSTRQQYLLDCLQRFAGIKPGHVLSPLSGPAWHYRRKARLASSYQKREKKLVLGFRAKASKTVVPVEHCPILLEPLEACIKPLVALVNSLDRPYAISHVELIGGDKLNAILLRLVKTISAADKNKLVEFARAGQYEIYLQTNDDEEPEATIEKGRKLKYTLQPGELVLEFPANAFIQVNALVNQMTVKQVHELMSFHKHDKVLDLFCGIGNFSLGIAAHVSQVTGVEVSKTSVQQANSNAALNHIDNARFVQADLSQDIQQASWFRGEQFSKILLDPPRQGAPGLMPVIARMGWEKLCYISCDPATLVRDVAELVQCGKFDVTHAGIMDMFPQTSHVESMVIIRNKKFSGNKTHEQ